jgi:hypothetical protein
VLLCVFGVCFTSMAWAQDRVQQFATQLRSNPDFRVRTQAALALGSSKDKRAVQPLCDGLEDTNTTVRAASAAGLGKLALGGEECQQERLSTESNTSVRSVIQKALEKVRGGGIQGTPLEQAEYYVGIGKVTNGTGRGDAVVNEMIRSAVLKALAQVPGFAVAPADESPEQARAVMTKHKLKAFFIWPKVSTTYAGGNLTVKFDLSLFTYPGKAFKASLNRKLTMPDTPDVDTEAEDELIGAAVENLIPQVTRVAGQISD